MAAVIVAVGALAAMLHTCASPVEPSTMRAIIAVESGISASGAGSIEVHPWAIGDNTTRKSYVPATYLQAVALADTLLRRRDNIDVGLAQVNSANFAAYKTSAPAMLQACQNLTVASSILANDYSSSAAVFSKPRAALWHAISAYNTGSLYAGARYVNKVVAQASRRPLVPSIELLTLTLPAEPTVQPAVVPARAIRVRVKVKPRRSTNFAFVGEDSRTLAVRLPCCRPVTLSPVLAAP